MIIRNLFKRNKVKGPSISISMVRNEQDIIEPFIRHHRKFFDKMFFIDHRSFDRTVDIIESCATELGGVYVSRFETKAQYQAEALTSRLKEIQQTEKADIVVPLDADEFLDCPSRGVFEDRLRCLSYGTSLDVYWKTLIPDPELSEEPCPVKRMRYCRVQDAPRYKKVLTRLHGNSDFLFRLSQGSHHFYDANDTVLPNAGDEVFDLLHLPARSRAQLMSKFIMGWSSHIRRTNKLQGETFQWARVGQQALETGFDPTSIEICESDEALHYAQTEKWVWPDNVALYEHNITTERKYSDGSFAPMSVIMDAHRKEITDLRSSATSATGLDASTS